MKLALLIVSVVIFAIAALLAVVGGHIGDLSPLDWAICGLPFFAASFLPIP